MTAVRDLLHAEKLPNRQTARHADNVTTPSLRLAPNAFEILAFYAGWAAELGEAERGGEMAHGAIRLNCR